MQLGDPQLANLPVNPTGLLYVLSMGIGSHIPTAIISLSYKVIIIEATPEVLFAVVMIALQIECLFLLHLFVEVVSQHASFAFLPVA